MSYTFKDNPEFHVWDLEDFESVDTKKRFNENHFFKFLKKGDSIMDLGCGPGYTVKVLQSNGFNTLGIDLNEISIRRAKEHGLNVEKLDAEEAVVKYKDSYNVFALFDFVEHIPLQVVVNILDEIRKVKNAKVFICTPNLNSLMGFKFWFHMPTHVNAMHPFVIRKMLDSMDFEIVSEWSEYGNLPGNGFKLWLRKKILKALFGTQSELFLGGANICFVAKTKS
jgi:SAM-dependent methyltransferase